MVKNEHIKPIWQQKEYSSIVRTFQIEAVGGRGIKFIARMTNFGVSKDLFRIILLFSNPTTGSNISQETREEFTMGQACIRCEEAHKIFMELTWP